MGKDEAIAESPAQEHRNCHLRPQRSEPLPESYGSLQRIMVSAVRHLPTTVFFLPKDEDRFEHQATVPVQELIAHASSSRELQLCSV